MNRFLVALFCLGLAVTTVTAAEPQAAPAAGAEAPAASSAPAAGAPAAGAPPQYDKKQYEEAFDGAMTCSALTAVVAQKAPEAEAWRWGNRSFAFGMLAVRFYTEFKTEPLSNEELDGILTQYANALNAMPDNERKRFEDGCARKYPDIDKLCEMNDCPRKPPGAEGKAPAAAPSAPAAPAEQPTKP